MSDPITLDQYNALMLRQYSSRPIIGGDRNRPYVCPKCGGPMRLLDNAILTSYPPCQRVGCCNCVYSGTEVIG